MPFAPEYLHLVFPNTQFEALLYGRASRDPKKQGYSVEDQLGNGRTLCSNNNWPIADEFKDLGLSASRHATRARDDFEDLLDAIETGPSRPGVTRIVVAFEASRYYRDLEAYVRLRNACANAGALLCYNGQVYDLSRREDRKATAMDALQAEDEAEGIRDRNLRTARATAERGDPHGRLLYGYAREYEVVNGRLRCVRQYEHETQGPYVLRAFEHIDAGRSLASLVRWLNSEEDAARPDGSEWTWVHVRRMLLNRSYLGERVHRGEWRPATWPPLKGLDTPAGRAMFNRVSAKLTDAERRNTPGRETAHMLSLIMLCGGCGDDVALVAHGGHGGHMRLRCPEKKDVSIREDKADAFVEHAVLSWFRNKKKAAAALVPDDGNVEEKVSAAQRRINAFEEQLAEARAQAEDYDEETGRFKLSAVSLAQLEQRLLPKLEAARKELQSVTGVSPLLLSLLGAEDPLTVWDGTDDQPGLTLDQKRVVIREVVTVRLNKATRSGPQGVEPGRITLAFVGEPGFRERPLRAPSTARGRARNAAGGRG